MNGAVVLATCNRMEIYAGMAADESAVVEVLEFEEVAFGNEFLVRGGITAQGEKELEDHGVRTRFVQRSLPPEVVFASRRQ